MWSDVEWCGVLLYGVVWCAMAEGVKERQKEGPRELARVPRE
jgi:hypothetical protein